MTGVLWNTHLKWYDEVIYCPLDEDGNVRDFDEQMIADSILLAMCYISNGTKEGFSLFTETELGLPAHSLKAMKNGKMFYDWFAPYKANLSEEGKELYDKMLDVYRFYFKHFGINANKNVGLNELKLSFMQETVNPTFEKVKYDNSITGNNTGSRVGANSSWRVSVVSRRYGTEIFSLYDSCLVRLMEKQYSRFIGYGMIDSEPSCVR